MSRDLKTIEINRPSTKQLLSNFWGAIFYNNFCGEDRKRIVYKKKCSDRNFFKNDGFNAV